jgi:hypothetical protein
MKCTDFVKGVAVGMVAGGTVVGVIKHRKKKPCGVVGRILKTAGHIVETLSDAMGI